MDKTLGIIPARGGSKGIPKKNIKLLLDKPLIAYTIELLRKSQSIDQFIVSTDSEEIANVARDFGAEVQMRPPHLSEDNSSMADVVRYVASKLSEFEFYLTVYPTVPLRIPEDVDGAVAKLRNSDYESLVSITQAGIHPYGGYSIEGDDLITNIENLNIYRRQDMRPLYQAMGGPYIVRKAFLGDLNNNMYTNRKTYYLIPKRRSVDIDENLDYLFAEFLLEKRLTE